MFQGHRLITFGEEDFLRFLSVIGVAAMLVMSPRPFEHFFALSTPEDYI